MESLPNFSMECPELWARLRARGWLWHSTPLSALERILSDGAIQPNTGQRRDTFHESKISCARHLRAVSLFDFATEDEAEILDDELTWRSVLFRQGLGAAVLIRVRSSALDGTKLLLPSRLRYGASPDIPLGWVRLSSVEALHIGPILASAFDGFLIIGRGDPDRVVWAEPKSHDNPVPELQEIRARWEADRERSRADRWARGEYLLSDIS